MAEETIGDQMAFGRCLGFSISDAGPVESAICRLRRCVAEQRRVSRLEKGKGRIARTSKEKRQAVVCHSPPQLI